MEWKTILRPGYMGNKRDEIYSIWDSQYGSGNWRLGWKYGEYFLEKKEALQIYEDAYFDHLRAHSQDLEWLVATASDIYDTAPSNVEAGLSYDKQETKNNHLHDVAIRRVLMRLGRQFKGDSLVQVRWTDSEGYRLNPGIVPFHKPELILPGALLNVSRKVIWWYANTIEDFYQRNKLLQVRE